MRENVWFSLFMLLCCTLCSTTHGVVDDSGAFGDFADATGIGSDDPDFIQWKVKRAQRHAICASLSTQFAKYAMLTVEEVASYCANECVFIPLIDCSYVQTNSNEVDFDFGKVFEGAGIKKGATTWELRGSQPREIGGINVPGIKRVFRDLLPLIIPNLAALFVVALKYHGASETVCWFSAMLLVGVDILYAKTKLMAVAAIVLKMFACMAPPRSQYLMQVGIASGLVLTASFAIMWIQSLLTQVFIAMVSIIVLGAQAFKSAKSVHASEATFVVFFITQGVYVIAFYAYVMASRGMDNAGIELINAFFMTIVPFGRNQFLIFNNADITSILLNVLGRFGLYPEDHVIFCMFILLFIVQLLFRAIVAWNSVASLRVLYDVRNIALGAYVYMIDVFQFMWLFRLLTGDARFQHRRAFYSVYSLMLFVIEYYFAVDVLMLRIAFWFLDKMVINSDFGKLTRILNADLSVECGGLSFGKIRAMPWIDTEQLKELSDAVKRITVSFADGVEKFGAGIVRCDPRGMTTLMTVKHVVDVGDTMRYVNHGEPISVPITFKDVGYSSDPIVSIATTKGGAKFSYITDQEIRQIKHLFVLHPSKMITFIDDFEIDRGSGLISASVNVMQGDSGSPVFAVLKCGSLRFAGAVSRGTFDEGTGNIISCIVGGVKAGSPGVDGQYSDETLSLNETRKDVLAGIARIQKDRAERVKKKGGTHPKKKGDFDERERAKLEALVTISGVSESGCEKFLLDFDEGLVSNFNILRDFRGYRTGGLGYMPKFVPGGALQ